MSEDRRTREVPAVGSTIREHRDTLQSIADELRSMGAGQQAERIDAVVAKLKTPTLRGIVAELAHPLVWPTREYALWMAERLTAAGIIICALREDAEITGSRDVIKLANDWLASLGFSD